MAEVFHEVDAQLRAARFQLLVRRGWPYALALVAIAAAVALAAWALNRVEQAQQAKASQSYAVGMQALGRGDLKGGASRFAELAKAGPRGYRALALMQQAGLALTAGRPEEATPLLDQAAQAAPNAVLGDAARLQAAYALLDTGAYAAARERLAPLSSQGRPYRLLATEALGLAELASGRIPQARGDLQVVALSSDASDAARARANAALALIASGSWSSLKPLARAAALLKPQPGPRQAPGLQGPGGPGGQAQSANPPNASQSGAAQ